MTGRSRGHQDFASEVQQRPFREPLYIEFDGGQLVARTTDERVRSFLAETFRRMLVPAITRRIASLDIIGESSGYRIESSASTVIQGDDIDYLLNRVREEVRFELMRARRDLLWLHAAAVERDGSALILSGPSGQGKSTLSSMLCQGGWRLMSDDAAPVRVSRNEVVAYNQSVVKRVPRDRAGASHIRKGLDRKLVAIPAERFSRDTAPVGRLVFLAFSAGAPAELRQLTRGETAMEILRNSVNRVDHEAGGMEAAALMARKVPGFALTYGDSAQAVFDLDTLP